MVAGGLYKSDTRDYKRGIVIGRIADTRFGSVGYDSLVDYRVGWTVVGPTRRVVQPDGGV